MSASSSTGAPARQHATEDVGWCLEKDSWAFQRSTFRVPGNPLAFGGYGHLRRQISSGEAVLLRFGVQGGLYRAQQRDGAMLDVLARARNGKRSITGSRDSTAWIHAKVQAIDKL